jgi:hypothetical protein
MVSSTRAGCSHGTALREAREAREAQIAKIS